MYMMSQNVRIHNTATCLQHQWQLVLTFCSASLSEGTTIDSYFTGSVRFDGASGCTLGRRLLDSRPGFAATPCFLDFLPAARKASSGLRFSALHQHQLFSQATCTAPCNKATCLRSATTCCWVAASAEKQMDALHPYTQTR